jgi:hypothetical protein
MVEILKEDPRVKGGWHYGSVGRGMSDAYSDYDPVFLVGDRYFNDFAQDVGKIVSQVSDELLISWAENYNDDYFKNFCNLIRIKDNLHQMDFFILNHDHLEAWFCRQHLKGCTRNNIIFDRDGEVGALLDLGLRTDNNIPDPLRVTQTYWFHIEMLVKYFKRNDVWKLVKNVNDFIFHAHVDVLLSQYDTLDWGAWETKLKTCVPEEKQAHLAVYFGPLEVRQMADNIQQGMEFFYLDSLDACRHHGIEYPESVARQVMTYFKREVNSENY